MTASNSASLLTVSANTADASQDELLAAPSVKHETSGAVLPRPISSMENIADTGRIRFGASLRMPVR